MGRLNVRVKSGKHLTNLQTFGTSDPYAVIQCGNRKYRTRAIDNSTEPEWNEDFAFYIADDNSAQINFEVWDENVCALPASLWPRSLCYASCALRVIIPCVSYPLCILTRFLPPLESNCRLTNPFRCHLLQ